jgi:hypothetical protein
MSIDGVYESSHLANAFQGYRQSSWRHLISKLGAALDYYMEKKFWGVGKGRREGGIKEERKLTHMWPNSVMRCALLGSI